jgi:signal transduction histidine kinase
MSFHHIFKLKMDLSKWKIDQAYLTPKLSKELFLVVREAITNSAKHAHATAITITGGILSDVLRISVTDNGRGFDTEHTRRANGLASMRYRMKELGGEFEIDSELGKGTTIKIAMPVSRTV